MDPNRKFHDIVTPKPQTPAPSPAAEPKQPLQPVSSEIPQPEYKQVGETPAPAPKSKMSLRKWIVGGLLLVVILVIAAAVGGYVWYQAQLQPVDPSAQGSTIVTIKKGSTITQIGETLESKSLIRNVHAFKKYVEFQGVKLYPGPYKIYNNASVEQIVSKLQTAGVEMFDIMFLPGATVEDAKKVLADHGYSKAAIDRAFSRSYDSPLFKGKPANTSLEGFIYGETYRFNINATPEDILKRTFDEMYAYIEQENLEAAYKKHGLSLYEGIILASIIQKEENDKGDMQKASQVFHKRLDIGMPLGSDVTFIYGARKLGVPPTVDLDSPYNTRIVKGLPPTPVATPGAEALYAAAYPANTDYLYFVAGDSGKTYYSKTIDEHERLTREYCHKNCILPSS